jgi:hypothetical protein
LRAASAARSSDRSERAEFETLLDKAIAERLKPAARAN